ncbi:MAG TPA: hypothetical protein VGW11_07695 [Solirubrobacteraceae bacterium]|nr:hypothetical protein [Solirubrobacteraceae bacterium]
MSELRSVRAVVLVALVCVVVAGGALRGVAASDPGAYQSADEIAYAMIARTLADRLVYGAPGMDDPVHWPPGAPVLFAAAHELYPKQRGDGGGDVAAAYPVQAAVGTAVIPAAFLLAMAVAGPLAGLGAATLVAFYPPLVDASRDLLSEPLGALLVTCALLAVALALRRPTWWRFAAAGGLLGATILTRADLVLVPLLAGAVAAVALWRRAEEGGRGPALRGVGAMAAGCLVLVAPWTWYASIQAETLVPVSSGGASNAFVGTLLPGEGSMFGAKRALAEEVGRRYPRYADEPSFRIRQVHLIDTVAARRPDLPPDEALRAETLANLERYALGEPLAFAGMMLDKVERLWLHYTTGTYRQERWWTSMIHVAIVALGVAGLAAAAARRRGGPVLWLLGLVLLYVTALNAVLISEARHNLAVMPLVAVGGAAGLALALRGRRARSSASGRSPSGSPAAAA